MSIRGIVVSAALALATYVAPSACNQQGVCPAPASIVQGAACDNDSLQCAYTLETPSPACDGTTTTIATSCTCTSSAWQCPAPVSCPGAPPSADDGGGDDGSTGDDGSSGDDGGGSDVASMGDAASE